MPNETWARLHFAYHTLADILRAHDTECRTGALTYTDRTAIVTAMQDLNLVAQAHGEALSNKAE